MLIELTNDFHNTATRVRTSDGYLSEGQVQRAWRALCGIEGCMCSGHAGVRGGEHRVEPVGDSYRVTEPSGRPLEPAEGAAR